ncbi:MULTISPECIES: hypothetical protein [unclassified Endozoicomonas]|uniref:hypothetical protein n=1 Tax=unclassified Endozoicomonas TaxID=2644528 RepID=UPI003BB6ECC5
MLRADFSSPSTTSAFTAASGNSDGFSDEKKHTQATNIKFGDRFRTICPVFSKPLLDQVNLEINNDDRYFCSELVNNFLDGHRGVRYINSSNIFESLDFTINSENPLFTARLCFEMPIQFDENSHLMNKEVFQASLTTSSVAIRALCSEALDKMADEFQWRDRSVNVVGIYLIRYPLIPSRGIKGMHWHKDPGKKSMVVQLNDNTNATKTGVKYSGGGLNIGKKSPGSKVTFPVKGTVENYPYGPNDEEIGNAGYMFSNDQGDLIHQPEDIVYHSENSDDLAEKRIIVVLVDD